MTSAVEYAVSPPAGLVVIIPCYNAGQRLRPVVEKALKYAPAVVVVDDGSTDGAVAGVRDLPVEVVALPENRGKGHAMKTGFRAVLQRSEMTCAGIVDADGQHDPAELPRLYEAFAREDADLVIGCRAFRGRHVPWRNWFGNKLTILLTKLLLGKHIPDTQSGYRLHSRRLLEGILEKVEGGRYETEMEILVYAVRGGYRVVPVEIRTIYEQGNPSSHFNKVKDSYRIYKRLFTVALRKKH